MVEKIDIKDFPETTASQTGPPASDETKAVRQLQPGEAIKFPCRWPHGRQCHGKGKFYAIARMSGFKIAAKCKDNMVFIKRHAN